MRDPNEPRRIGPLRFAMELLSFVERQLAEVREDLGPRAAGFARLVVVALALAAAAGLVLSLGRLAQSGARSIASGELPCVASPGGDPTSQGTSPPGS